MSIDFQRRFDRILYQIFGKSFRNQSKSLTSSLEIIEIPQKSSSQQYLQDLVSGYGLAWLLWIWVQTSAWICHVSWDPSLDISGHIFTVSVGHCIWIQSRLDTVNIGSDLSVTMFRDGWQDIPGHMVEPSWSLRPVSRRVCICCRILWILWISALASAWLYHISCDVLGSIPDHSQAGVSAHIHIIQVSCYRILYGIMFPYVLWCPGIHPWS